MTKATAKRASKVKPITQAEEVNSNDGNSTDRVVSVDTDTDSADTNVTAIIIPSDINDIKNDKLRAEAYAIRNAIIGLQKRTSSTTLEIASRLKRIKDQNLYAVDGFNSISEFGQKIFGYKRAMVSKLVKAGGYVHYNEDTGFYESCFGDGKYNAAQIFELMRLPEDDMHKLVNEGTVTSDMSSSAIRGIVAPMLKSLKGEVEVSNETDTATDSNNLGDSDNVSAADDSASVESDLGAATTSSSVTPSKPTQDVVAASVEPTVSLANFADMCDKISVSDLANIYGIITNCIVSRGDMVIPKRLSDTMVKSAKNITDRFVK